MSPAPPPAPAHQLFVAHVAYGHARPLLFLALNLLRMHPHQHITYLAARQLESKLLAEVSHFGAGEDVLARLHVVFFGDVDDKEGAGLVKVPDCMKYVVQALGNFGEKYKSILKGDPLFDTSTSSSIAPFPCAPPLTRVVTDVLMTAHVATIKTTIDTAFGIPEEQRSKLVTFAPVSSSFVAAYFFQPPDSIIPDVYARSLEVLQAPGNELTEDDIYRQFADHNDSIVNVIGAGDVFIHELQPSSARAQTNAGWLTRMSALVSTIFDRSVLEGIIVVWEGDYVPEVSEIAKKTFGRFWEVGPQLSPGEWAEGGVKEASGAVVGKKEVVVGEFKVEDKRGEACLEFLDRAGREEGERSVLVISFGSLFAIPTLTHISVLLATLNELKIRFIFARGILDADMIAEVERQCALSEGRGLLATWIPQNAVLAHPATSFFLTHCGSNSVQESILHGIPMIAWPGAADQPTIALELSQRHKVAFELLQVRTEYNIGRPTKRGPVVVGTEEAMREEMVDVFTRMRGEEGVEMKRRVGEMREVMVRSCRTEGGRSYEAMRDLGL